MHSLKEDLLTWGWAIDKEKFQQTGLSVKFLGVMWLGKTKSMTVSQL